jgi:hypothetical protein
LKEGKMIYYNRAQAQIALPILAICAWPFHLYWKTNIFILIPLRRLARPVLKEIEVNEPRYFSVNFHLIEANQLLFSTTLTATTFDNKLPETNDYYQYFETKWYRLKITSKGISRKKPEIELKEYEFWKKSEIKTSNQKKLRIKYIGFLMYKT